ncbi:MAG TPA: glycoside hydrolase family 43 protein [Metabacillus sp.]|nr:glycoside hydrolase family 43 protein [Metabacillus sp.]
MIKKWLAILVLVIMVPTFVIAMETSTVKEKKSMNQSTNSPDIPEFTNASVHDPSIIKVDNEYYVFGSHLAAAKSKDLMKWELVATGANVNNPLFDNVVEELKETFDWAQSDTLWAADVIQLEDGKFYMYYNACKGDSPRSALGLAVADHIEGPYKDKGIFLKSGMWGEPSEDGSIYDATIHPNVVDPHTFYDEEGKLWMLYGSYSGGIFILEMDPETGFPLPDQGYGKKLLGGNHSRIEGAYIQYHPETNYYYMYLSFGGLDTTGGYNVRVIRSKNPDGPYYDSEGNDMINVKADPTLPLFDDKSIEPFAVKLMGNHLFERKIGDPGEGIGAGYISPGHNSTYYDPDTGKQFIIFHTRFPEKGEQHEIRVHQMFMNKNDWPVIAPYRYAGETIEKIKRDDVIGTYQMINHEKDISGEVKKPVYLTLEKNNKIRGELSGTWKKTGHNQAELHIDGNDYDGVFLRQWDEVSQGYVLTFSVLSKEGVALWGSKILDKTDQEIIEDVKNDLDLGDTSKVLSNLTLPSEGTRGTNIFWKSSNVDVITGTGVINRPEAFEDPVTAILTQRS